MLNRYTNLFLSGLLLVVLAGRPAFGNEAAPPEAPQGEGAAAHGETSGGGHDKKADAAAKDGAEAAPAEPVDAYCDGIIDPARERRYYLKQEELKALLANVDQRLKELEAKKADYQEWVRRREDFAQRATKSLVEIYSNMKPEAAAARISALQTDLAASLLLAISPRQASAILNEMDEKTAANLTGIMAASARAKDPT